MNSKEINCVAYKIKNNSLLQPEQSVFDYAASENGYSTSVTF